MATTTTVMIIITKTTRMAPSGVHTSAEAANVAKQLSLLNTSRVTKVGGGLFWHKNIHNWTWCTESQMRLHGASWRVLAGAHRAA